MPKSIRCDCPVGAPRRRGAGESGPQPEIKHESQERHPRENGDSGYLLPLWACRGRLTLNSIGVSCRSAAPIGARHSRESGNPDGFSQARHMKSGTNTASGSLLPSWVCRVRLTLNSIGVSRCPAAPISARHSRESGNPDGCSQARHPKSGTNAVNGSLLPSWEKARMRVSSRASAALRAGRPRSQATKPTPVSPSSEKVRMRVRRAPRGANLPLQALYGRRLGQARLRSQGASTFRKSLAAWEKRPRNPTQTVLC